MATNLMEPEVIYADEAILVVNKPHKLLSVPGLGPEKQDCLIRRLQQRFYTARIVHRLDYATSGIMVLALTADSHRHLSMQFQERTTSKRYQAVVDGIPTEKSGKVDLPLRCDWDNRPKQMVCHENGKQAQTLWQVTETLEDRSRVLLTPITGRSHQLRVHMLSMGHAILGDEFYANETALAKSERLLLHAEQLGFQHPVSGEAMHFDVPCPF